MCSAAAMTRCASTPDSSGKCSNELISTESVRCSSHASCLTRQKRVQGVQVGGFDQAEPEQKLFKCVSRSKVSRVEDLSSMQSSAPLQQMCGCVLCVACHLHPAWSTHCQAREHDTLYLSSCRAPNHSGDHRQSADHTTACPLHVWPLWQNRQVPACGKGTSQPPVQRAWVSLHACVHALMAGASSPGVLPACKHMHGSSITCEHHHHMQAAPPSMGL